MDTYEQVNAPKTEKKSPYADAPYACAYIEPEQTAPEIKKTHKPKRWKPLVVVLLLVSCCVATAFGVNQKWRNRINRMETALDEKFAVLQEKYDQLQKQNADTQLPAEGPMTPGQVYAQNAKAVVAVITRYESTSGTGEGVGSGFLISADGYVVTNYHVIDGASQVSVTTNAGDSLTAKIVGHDTTNDIALLKVEGENLPFVTLGSSDALAVGDQVAAIGNPLGDLTATLTVGYVSAKDRIVSTDGTVINMLQTDAAINSGNSGGPLFNMNGQVVGIITAKYSGSSASGASIEGLGFAIPMDDVVGIISDLREYGYVTGAYIGVYVRDVSAAAQSYGLPAGAYVEEAMKGYAAERAGIRAGDIIVNLGGHDVDSVTTLTRVLRRFKAGEAISVTVYRGGQREYLTVTLDEKPVEQQQQPTEEETPAPNAGNNKNWFDFFAPFFGG